jgi:hypothetical protein
MLKVVSQRSAARQRERMKPVKTGHAVRALYQSGREERALVNCTPGAGPVARSRKGEAPCRVLRFPERSLAARAGDEP